MLSICIRNWCVPLAYTSVSYAHHKRKNFKNENFGAVHGTLFIYFVIFLTIHIHYSSSGCSPAGYSFFLSWVNDSCIWANSFLPAGSREGCRAGIEPGAAVKQPSTLTTKPCCTVSFSFSAEPYCFASIQNTQLKNIFFAWAFRIILLQSENERRTLHRMAGNNS